MRPRIAQKVAVVPTVHIRTRRSSILFCRTGIEIISWLKIIQGQHHGKYINTSTSQKALAHAASKSKKPFSFEKGESRRMNGWWISRIGEIYYGFGLLRTAFQGEKKGSPDSQAPWNQPSQWRALSLRCRMFSTSPMTPLTRWLQQKTRGKCSWPKWCVGPYFQDNDLVPNNPSVFDPAREI